MPNCRGAFRWLYRAVSGDGVVIYFGYPSAHESDAQNAVQSALEILARIADIRNQALQVRIGISMGEVVVGDLLVEGEHKQHSVVGQTPNLAARLMGEAEAGQIVVSENIHRLLLDLSANAERVFSRRARLADFRQIARCKPLSSCARPKS